ncbi:DUF6686 family protein [Nonlabens agnitus]|uniref:Uncharacterized protein n=1 Tax=Nonlabens agnitus TaxID=870484 RepID=A0A2S9WVZ4_9FLAO|nr:DUF6686 family protein [Nonlabens agnitus]PRP67638.1 hypothetical protein BST86_11320 [Nonlabens agnitus]
MSQTLKTLSQNKSGHLTYCKESKCYFLNFSVLSFTFSHSEFIKFKNYLNDVPVKYWSSCKENYHLKRKIPLHTRQQNLILMFNHREFMELKSLVNHEKPLKEQLTIMDIDSPLMLN